MPTRPILLINPPSPGGRTVNREGFGGLGVLGEGRRLGLWPRGFVYPSMLLAEAAGWLRERGLPFRAGDAVLEPVRGPAKVFGRLPELSRRAPVVVRIAAASLDHDLAWARREAARFADPLVLAGMGLEALAERISAVLPEAAIGVRYSGFELMRDVLALPPGGGGPGEASPATSPAAEPGPDSWPFADWSALPLGRSRRLPMHHARGCTFECAYCPYVLPTGRRLIVRSPQRSAEEFAHQVRAHRPKRVVFRDPAFGLARESTLELLARIASLPRSERAPFEIETRPEILDAAMVAALARAGAAEIKLGVETVDPAALLAARRVADAAAARDYAEAVEQALARAREHGIAVRLFVLEGLPSATPESEAALARRFAGHPLLVSKRLRDPDPRAAPL